MLAGLSPEIICDIAARAISFHTYQTQQEACFQQMIYKNLDVKCNNLESELSNVIAQANHEINLLRQKNQDVVKESQAEKKRIHELTDQVNDKNKQFMKLQAHYDKLKKSVCNY